MFLLDNQLYCLFNIICFCVWKRVSRQLIHCVSCTLNWLICKFIINILHYHYPFLNLRTQFCTCLVRIWDLWGVTILNLGEPGRYILNLDFSHLKVNASYSVWLDLFSVLIAPYLFTEIIQLSVPHENLLLFAP